MLDIKDITNTIIQGDCLEVMKSKPDNCVDLVLTDPPYFLPVQHYVGTIEKGYSKRSLADTSVLKGYFAQITREFDRITKPAGTIYMFCDGQSYPIFYEALYPHCKHVRPLIWDKIVSFNGYTWRHGHELIAWGERDETERVPTGDSDILRCRGVLQKDRFHPAEKPVKLLKLLIKKHEKGIVLDPFMGSGSTLAAASIMESPYIGIELQEEYCEIARKRVQEAKDSMGLFAELK